MAVASVSPLIVLILLLSGGGLTPPLGIPPTPEDPFMQQVAPAECLAYTTWAGMATPSAKSANQTEQLLAEPELRKFAQEVLNTIDKAVAKQAAENGPPAVELARDASGWVKAILSHPAAIYLGKVTLPQRRSPMRAGTISDLGSTADQSRAMSPDNADVRAGAIFNLGTAAATIRKQIDKYLELAPSGKLEKLQIAGLDGYRAITKPNEPAVAWAFKGSCLLIGIGQGELEALAGRLGAPPPKWLTEILKQAPVARRSAITYLNLRAIRELVQQAAPPQEPSLAKVLSAVGFDRLQSLISVSGMDEEGMLMQTLVRFDGELSGVFDLLDKRPLTPGDLACIPHSAVLAGAARVDFVKTWQTIEQIVGQIDAQAGAKLRGGLKEAEANLGLDLHNDLLKPVGNVLCFYLPSAGMATGFNATVSIAVRDRARLATTHDKLWALAEMGLAQANAAGRPKLEKSEFAGHTLYSVVLPQPNLPIRPSWCLSEKELVIGLLPGCVKEHVLRDQARPSLAQAPEIKALFAASPGPSKLFYQNVPEMVQLAYPYAQLGLVMLSGEMAKQGFPFDVAALPAMNTLTSHLRPDTTAVMRTPSGITIRARGTLPFLSPNAPAVVGFAAGLILPAVNSVRTKAREMSSMNNMKQLTLATLMYEQSKGALPPAYSADKQGQPLLSWRVQILPYLDGDALYKEFHLDEPWDSPHNKQLIARMPAIFRSPDSALAMGKTRYLAVRGEHTVFSGAKGVKLAEIVDGLSNTILFVEAAPDSAVVWTKPDDFTPNADDPAKGLCAPGSDGFHAAFVDGHVQRIRRALDAKKLQALFTRAGHEVVELEQ